MGNSLHEGFVFLISSIFDLYLFILVVRLVLVWAGANWFDPITQFIVKVTNFIITPLRRMIPNVGKLELATLLVILAMEAIKFCVISLMSVGTPNAAGVLVLASADTLKLFVQFFFYAILIQVVMSWIQPQSPMMRVLYQVTSPIMRPVQRLVPPIGGMDISPIPAMIGLQLLLIMLVNPLMGLGLGIAFGG